MATDHDFQSAHVTSFLVCLLNGLQKMQNLFPVQIENALTDHPGIREAAAIAVPDTKYGEVVGAWIAREPGTDVSRAEVRRAVADAMNPQVSGQLSRSALVLGTVHVHSGMEICNGVCWHVCRDMQLYMEACNRVC